ncbi:MAG: flavin reductase family protein [Eubacteriales bacterium]|jgi:flavin reductase (DIM6/NTAB) family NADH-FMN oxidoreductase RutF
MEQWKEIKPEDLSGNPFEMIGQQWMLIAAEKEGRINAMTASWGGMGVMWGKPVAFCCIRPQRFTKEFVNAAGEFSLTFFGKDSHDMLGYMGKVSGRQEDKIAHCGLTVLHHENVPYFGEAHTALVCKTLFAQPYSPDSFLFEDTRSQWYPQKDYHTLYIAEIKSALVRE